MNVVRRATSSVPAMSFVVALMIGGVGLVASVAGAQALDTVMLPGGGRIRGTVEVYEPGRQVVVLLPDGSRRRLRRGEFESVVFGDAPSSPPTEPAPPTPIPTPVPPEAAAPVAPPDPAPDVAAAPGSPAPGSPAPGSPTPEAPPSSATPPAAVLEPVVPPGSGAPSITPDAQQLLEGAIPGMAAPVAPMVAPTIAFGDGAADGAWPEDDPHRIPRPVGMIHFGVQLLGTLQISAGLQSLFLPADFLHLPNLTPGVEVAGYVDVRLALPVHIRGALVVAGFGDVGGVHRRYDYGGSSSSPSLQSTTLHGRGVLELGVRGLIGILLSDGFAMRFGAQGGMEWLSTVARAEGYADGILELAVRVLDSRFEIVAQTALGVRSIGFESYAATDTRMGTSSGFSARVSLGIGYVLH